MALVADYGPGSSSDEDEDLAPSSSTQPPPVAIAEPVSSSSTTTTVKKPSGAQRKGINFFEDSSSEDEDVLDGGGGLGQFLPKPKRPSELPVEENVEEIGPIPPKKIYGDEEEKPPAPSPYHNITAKRVKGVVRIAAPSLKDFDGDEKDQKIPQRFISSSKKGSGLFAMLPEPKGPSAVVPKSFLKSSSNQLKADDEPTPSSSSAAASSSRNLLPRSLIPDSVKLNMLGKRPTLSKLDEIKAKYLKQEANVVIVSRADKSKVEPPSSSKGKDSDDSDEEGPNFFSFKDEEEIDEETLEKLKLPAPDFTQKASSSATLTPTEEEEEEGLNYNEASSSTQQGEVVRYMKQKKKGKGNSEVNFIDVNADDLRPDSTEWLKNMTDESAIPARRGKGLGGMQKKKHQITYLAVEAKAREQELQQQWAQNRQNRRATQMKYGFS